MKKIMVSMALAAISVVMIGSPISDTTSVNGDVSTSDVAYTPKLEFVLDLKVALQGTTINVGQVPLGNRSIVPITGGTFSGPNISGIIVAGGADYQLMANGVSHLNAIYSIRTHDNVNILVRNEGIVSLDPKNPYFFTTPHFEAPVDSKYNWLNRSTFICRPISFEKGITLRVWRVVEVDAPSL